MTQQDYINALNEAWGFEGFLGNLKEGVFNEALYNKLHETLKAIHIDEEDTIQRDLIQLLWFIPIFMYRQKEYFPAIASSKYDALREHLEEELSRIFILP